MLAGRSAARNVVLTRIFVAAVGCTAVMWGLVTLPIFWRQSTLERTAQSITSGASYKVEALAGVVPLIQATEKTTFCAPTALRSAAIIRLRIAELGQSGDAKEKSDTQINAAANSVRESLSCSPADSFLWLALYWLHSAQHGYRPEDLKYLRLSYQLGPNEGWIAEKRNGVTFAMLQQLPSDARAQLPAPSSPYWCDQRQCILSNFSETAINEFVRLVSSDLLGPAAEIFTGPAWPERELILPHLASISEQDRRRFSDVLHGRGYDVNVPGIAPRSISEPPPGGGALDRSIDAILGALSRGPFTAASSRVDGVAGSVPSRPFTIP